MAPEPPETHGDGLQGDYPHARKGHDHPYILLCHEITKIIKIINRPKGISIFCKLYKQDGIKKFEHFHIWYAPNAKEKLREYFNRKSKSSRGRLNNGRLKEFIATVMDGPVDEIQYNGFTFTDRPLPVYSAGRSPPAGDDPLSYVPEELMISVPIERKERVRNFLNYKAEVERAIAERDETIERGET